MGGEGSSDGSRDAISELAAGPCHGENSMSLDSCGCPKRWRGKLGYRDPYRSVGHALSLSVREGRKGEGGQWKRAQGWVGYRYC